VRTPGGDDGPGGLPLRAVRLRAEGYFAVGELTQVPRGREPRGTVAATRAQRKRSPRAAGIPRRLWERATGGKGLTILAAVAVAVSVFAAAACGGTEQARAGAAVADPGSGPKTEGKTSAPAAEASAGGDGNDPVVAKAGTGYQIRRPVFGRGRRENL
jgi:hypothetical protein